MATIRQKNKSWQVQIRRQGWPWQSASFASKKDAQAWARLTETQMDQGLFVDQSEARQTSFGQLIELYIDGVTRHRPSEQSLVAEEARLRRFLRDEPRLCAHAVFNLKPEHFENFRDRRLAHEMKNGKTIAPGTVKRELTMLKRVIDYRKRALGLIINPVNTEDVKRPTVNDERDVRLTPQERACFLKACDDARNPLLRLLWNSLSKRARAAVPS